MKIIEKQKAEVTIRRPDGTVETVVHPKIDYFTPELFRQMKKAMAEAGRGEVLSYRNIDAVVMVEDSDYQVRCERCGRQIDSRTAYRQQETDYLGASKIKVTAYYCEHCRQLLNNIGAGEYTALEERASADQDNTPYYKED